MVYAAAGSDAERSSLEGVVEGRGGLDGALSGMALSAVREVGASLEERIRAAEEAIAEGRRRLGSMARGAARDAEEARLAELEEEKRRLEAGLLEVQRYVDGRVRSTEGAADKVLEGVLGMGREEVGRLEGREVGRLGG